MDSVKILVFPVSLILMLDGPKAQNCKPCLNLHFKTNLLPFLGSSSNGFNLETDRNCSQMGSCSLTSDPEKVSKCAVYQGTVILNLGTVLTTTKITAGLVFRKCEEVSTNEPSSCSSINTDKDLNINFFDDVLSMLLNKLPILKNILSSNDIAFNGSRCLNEAIQRGSSGSDGNAWSGSDGNTRSGSGGNAPSGASISKNSQSRSASMLMVVLVLAVITFDFEA